MVSLPHPTPSFFHDYFLVKTLLNLVKNSLTALYSFAASEYSSNTDLWVLLSNQHGTTSSRNAVFDHNSRG